MERALNNWGLLMATSAAFLFCFVLALVVSGVIGMAPALLLLFLLDAIVVFGIIAQLRRRGIVPHSFLILSFYASLTISFAIAVNMIA